MLKKIAAEEGAEFIEADFSDINVKKDDVNSQIFDFSINGKEFKDMEIRLIGEHQVRNCVTALNAIDYLRRSGKVANITDESVKAGILETKWPGRVEKVMENPTFIIDGAHAIDYLRRSGKVANITDESVKAGILETKWPGRVEKVMENPTFIIDGAHNEDGARSLRKVLDKYFADRNLVLMLGMLEDKDIDTVLEILMPVFHTTRTVRDL